jgi:antitoxin PrlF
MTTSGFESMGTWLLSTSTAVAPIRFETHRCSVRVFDAILKWNLSFTFTKCKGEAVAMEATLSSKNQVTIPKQVRDYLNLKAGDRFKFFLQPDGRVVILPKIRITKLKGSVRKLARPVSLEEMDGAVADGATRRHRK